LALGSARALRQHLFGRGVEDRHGQVAGYHFAVDEKTIVAHWLCSPCQRAFGPRYMQGYITYAATSPRPKAAGRRLR
jgi:hypothetical protein